MLTIAMVIAVLSAACSQPAASATQGEPVVAKHSDAKQVGLSEAEAIETARKDAETAYRDLSVFEVHARREGDVWHVDYRLRNKELAGGGPHYLIDAKTGRILKKRYQQ